MAEERVVRLRLERVGFDDAEKGSASLETKLEKLAGAEQKLNRDAKPAAASVSKLAQEEGKAGSAAAGATPKVDKLGNEIADAGKQAAGAAPKLDAAKKSAAGLGDAASKLGGQIKGALAAFLGFEAIKGFLVSSVTAIGESESATARLEARLRSTEGTGGRTFGQLSSLAEQLSADLGIDDEAIAGAEAALLKYQDVAAGVFDRTMRLAADMAAESGSSIEAMADQLGKGLNELDEGLPMLEKSVGRFTDAEGEAIKKAAQMGDEVKAQTLTLEIMERRVGGTAAALRNTLAGALAAVSVEIENQQEGLQGGLSPAIRQIAEDYIRWARSAEGQKQVADLGERIGDVLQVVAGMARDVAAALDTIDAGELADTLQVTVELAGSVTTLTANIVGAHSALSSMGGDGASLNPLMASIWAASELMKGLKWYVDQVNRWKPGGGPALPNATPEEVQGAQQGHAEVLRQQADVTKQLAAIEAARRAGQREDLALVAQTRQGAMDLLDSATANTEALRRQVEIIKARKAALLDAAAAEGRVRDPNAAIRLRQSVGMTGGVAPSGLTAQEVGNLQKLENALAGTEHRLRLTEAAGTDASKALEALGFGASRGSKQISKAGDDAWAAAQKLVRAIEEEARRRREALEILNQQGVSQKEIIRQLREKEIAEKSNAKIEEVRLAYLKAGKTLTDANAEAIRGWVREAEKATDAADAWAKARQQMSAVGGVDTSTLDARLAVYIQRDQERRAASFAIDQANRDAFDQQREDVRQQLEDQALFFKESLATPRQQFEAFKQQIDELEKATDSAGNKILTAAEAEMLRGRAAEAFYSQQLDAWTGFLSYLGDAFGGFFAEVASIAQGVQQVNSTADSLGGWSSMAGAWGGTIAAFVELYKFADSVIKKHDSQKYGTRASVDRTYGLDVMSFSGGNREITNASMQLARSIRDAIETLEDSLRISIADLEAIEIRASNDGKKVQVWIAGVYYNTFSDMNEAIRAAAVKALQQSGGAGMSDLMAQGLGSYTSPDTEGLMEFLQVLREISDLSLTSGAIDLQQTIHQLEEMWAALERLPAATPAVIEGFQNLGASIVDAWQAWADSISGRQKTKDELLREKEKDAALFEKQRALFIAEQKLRVMELREKLENLKARANITQREGAIDAGGLGVRIKLMQAEAHLTGAESDLASQRIALIQEQIDAIQGIISEIEKIEPPKPGLGGGGGGGGRSGTDLKDLREQLRDEIARLQAEAKGPLHAAFFDLQQSIEDFRERAKEAKLPADELAVGIAALTEAFRRDLLARARNYAGQGTDFTARLKEVQDFFDELRRLGRGKTGIEKFRVDSLEQQALAKLGGEIQRSIAEFGGLVNPMLAIQAQAGELRTNLLAFAQAAGWSAEQIDAALAQIEGGVELQRQQGISGLLDQVFGLMDQAGMQAAESVQHEREKALLQLEIIEAQFVFFNGLTTQISGWLDGLRDWVNSDDFQRNFNRAAEVLYNPPSTWSWNDVAEKVKDALSAWREGVRDFANATQDLLTNDELSGLTQEQQLAVAKQQMLDLATRARGGDVEALKQLAAAREEFLAESRQSNQGGSSYTTDWQLAMIETADLLANAQEIEEQVTAKAIADAIAGNANNAQEITAAVYDGAAQVVAAIYRLMQGLPAYGEGGYVDRPHLAIVGDRPEYILPAVPGLRGPGTVSVVHGAPSSSRSDALLEQVLREQRRHTSALRSTAYSSGSTARSSRDLLDAETRARVVNGRKR